MRTKKSHPVELGFVVAYVLGLLIVALSARDALDRTLDLGASAVITLLAVAVGAALGARLVPAERWSARAGNAAFGAFALAISLSPAWLSLNCAADRQPGTDLRATITGRLRAFRAGEQWTFTLEGRPRLLAVSLAPACVVGAQVVLAVSPGALGQRWIRSARCVPR